MSGLAKRLSQCKKPSGELGKRITDEMNERHYQLTSWGLEKVHIAKDSIILDIGCGGGKTVNRLADIAYDGKVFGIDHSLDCVTWSKDFNETFVKEGRVKILFASAEKIPFPDNTFDIVTAVETVYFWTDLNSCFKEINRVLKPSGKLFIINEVYDSEVFKERNEALAAAGEMKIFSLTELTELVKKSGFLNVVIDLVEEKNWLCCIGEK